MIVYTKHCLACADKQLWKRLKVFVADNNLTLEVRRTGMSKGWKAEAEQYEVDLPFAVNGKIALNLYQDLEELL